MFDVNQKVSDYLSLVVTHECNKACPFCVDEYRGSGEFISLGTVETILSKAKGLKIKDVLVVGGEPTLHPQIVEIVTMVKAAGFRVIMTTNYTKPDVVKTLDGLVDCFNISYYGQSTLPDQKDMESDITVHALIYKKFLSTKIELDEFIDKYEDTAHLKFSTLTPCNEWAEQNQKVAYLDDLESENVVLFGEMLGQIYRGCVIKRYDKIFSKNSTQSWKAHVDGELSKSWTRKGA